MGPDMFNLLLSGWLLFIFGTNCALSIVFTFSLPIYLRIEEKLKLVIFSDRVITTILDRNIDWFNVWLMKHNKITGIILIILSLVDLKLSFDIVNML